MSTINLSPVFPANEQRVIQRALRLLEKYQRQPSESFTSTSLTKTWLQLQMAHLEREVFIVMYLDNQHCLLERETLFTGTLSHTEVHPREVVKSALKHNAAAVIWRITPRPARQKSASRINMSLSELLQPWLWWKFVC